MSPDEMTKRLGRGLVDEDLEMRNGCFYRRHPEFVWAVYLRRPFAGSRLAVDIGVSVQELSSKQWPTDSECQLQTSYERLGATTPTAAAESRWPERGAYFGVLLDGDDRLMEDPERTAGLQFIADEIGRTTAAVDSLPRLAQFFRRPDVRKPLMDKRLRAILVGLDGGPGRVEQG